MAEANIHSNTGVRCYVRRIGRSDNADLEILDGHPSAVRRKVVMLESCFFLAKKIACASVDETLTTAPPT